MKNGLTLTMAFEAESANYGEGIGNITTLKKMTRSDGNMYTYISRQAMRYNIVQQMGIDNTPVSGEKGTVQFAPNATIADYPEIDLFGYMKTRAKAEDDKGGADTRSAVCRLSNAISMEPFESDLDFLTNMGLSKRDESLQNGIAQSEIHHSYYSYTITVDLDRVGEDVGISLDNDEKAKRVCNLLETIEFLYRDIKGRRENLAPVFVVGGVYERKCPYFEGRLKLNRSKIDYNAIYEVMNSCQDTKENTKVGILDGTFANCDEAKEKLNATSISNVFTMLKEGVEEHYA